MIFECSATDILCTSPPWKLKEYLQKVVGKNATGREEVRSLKNDVFWLCHSHWLLEITAAVVCCGIFWTHSDTPDTDTKVKPWIRGLS